MVGDVSECGCRSAVDGLVLGLVEGEVDEAVLGTGMGMDRALPGRGGRFLFARAFCCSSSRMICIWRDDSSDLSKKSYPSSCPSSSLALMSSGSIPSKMGRSPWTCSLDAVTCSSMLSSLFDSSASTSSKEGCSERVLKEVEVDKVLCSPLEVRKTNQRSTYPFLFSRQASAS